MEGLGVMTKTRNGILLAGVLLATSIFAGRAVAGEMGGVDALASWGTVPTTELGDLRGREGVQFDISIFGSAAAVGANNSGSVANDGSVAVGDDSVAAVGGSTAIGDGAQAGDNGTAVGSENSGAVATGDGTTAVGGDANDSFNTSNDVNLNGQADASGTIDHSSVGDIGSTGEIHNLGITGMSGVSTVMNNTGALVNMQNSMVFNIYMQ